jgi:hypothetical protein
LLENKRHRGKIVIKQGVRRPEPNFPDPAAQAFQPGLAQAKGS